MRNNQKFLLYLARFAEAYPIGHSKYAPGTMGSLIGVLVGHFLFAIALTQLLDWSWLKNLMTEEDKIKMLNNYTWKDLLVDGAIIAVVIGIIFLVSSIFL